MPFKLHLLIIACIIMVVMVSWEFINNPFRQSADKHAVKTLYNLSVTHASWGLNCRGATPQSGRQDDFLNKSGPNRKLHEDNILEAVSHLCNGNSRCDVPIDEATLGPDPAPDCANKVLEIEYRCFSYDRPWYVKTSSGPASLHCDDRPNE